MANACPRQDDFDVIETAARLIREGSIVAIKGIGGIHLACDAGNEKAVNRLRERKHRYHKAFALMARDTGMVRRYADVAEEEVRLLLRQGRPHRGAKAQGRATGDSVCARSEYPGLHAALHPTASPADAEHDAPDRADLR